MAVVQTKLRSNYLRVEATDKMSGISEMPQLGGSKIVFVFRRNCFIFQLWLLIYQLVVVKIIPKYELF